MLTNYSILEAAALTWLDLIRGATPPCFTKTKSYTYYNIYPDWFGTIFYESDVRGHLYIT